MEKKIRELKELIEQKQVRINAAPAYERIVLLEDLADMELALRLYELTHANETRRY